MDETELRKAKFYGLKVINFQPRSTVELKEKLAEKGFCEEIIEQVLAEFAKKGLLNDLKFSKLWIESRLASNPKGGAILRQELRAKGVSKEVIEETLKAVKGRYSEYDIVKKLADERMGQLRGLDKTTAKRRLFGFLRRRGFDFEIIMKVLEEIF